MYHVCNSVQSFVILMNQRLVISISVYIPMLKSKFAHDSS